MEGRKYNRAVRLHKLVYEALMRLSWNGFTSWIQDNYSGEVVHLEETLRSIRNLSDNVCQSSFSAVLENASCTHINKLFQTYLNFLRDGMEMEFSQIFGCPILTW